MTEAKLAELMERITVNQEQCEGRPCIRRMRIRLTFNVEAKARTREGIK